MKKNIFFIAILGIASLGLRGIDESKRHQNKSKNKFFTLQGEYYKKETQYPKDVTEQDGALYKVTATKAERKNGLNKTFCDYKKIKSLNTNDIFDEKTKILIEEKHSILTGRQKTVLGIAGALSIMVVTAYYI